MYSVAEHLEGGGGMIFLSCFVFWQVTGNNREKQLHQKYQRDCFQVTGSLINHIAYLIYVTQLHRMLW